MAVACASLVTDGGEWTASLRNGESVRARTVFLATGKHDLRGFGRRPAKQSDLIGFKLHWQLPPAQMQALHGYMDLYLFSGGYGGVSLIENGIANLCLVVRRSTLRRVGAWPELFEEILRENRCLRRLFKNGRALWPRPLAITPIPYGYLATESRGLWCIGDQAAVTALAQARRLVAALPEARPSTARSSATRLRLLAAVEIGTFGVVGLDGLRI